MTPRGKPSAIDQWWLDKRAHLEGQLTLAAKNDNKREASRLERSIERIDVMLASMKR